MLANLRALFGVFVDIMLLRRGPEHVPASPTLLVVLVALDLVLYSIGIELLLPVSRPDAPAPWLVHAVIFALVLSWYRVAFHLLHRPERYVQTMIALFAVNLMVLPSLPLFAAMAPYMSQEPGGAPAPASLSMLVSLVIFWVAAIQVRIVKAAFEWPWAASIVFVIGTGFALGTLLGLIFGASPKPA